VESEWSRKRVRWVLSKAIGPALLAAATFGLSCSSDRFSTAPQTAGFWFERSSLELPSAATRRLGGPLTADELKSIKDLSRSERDHAFSSLRIAVTESPNAFWRVEVIQSSPVKWTRLGVAASHNDGDEMSYEYGSPDRLSQYYGELHWTTAWPLLASKFGTDSRQTRR
jgi:hypothetical protein